MSYVIAVAARWAKSVKFTPSIAVHSGGLAKISFLACDNAINH